MEILWGDGNGLKYSISTDHCMALQLLKSLEVIKLD